MGVRNVQLPPDTRCKAAILLRLITLLLLATEFNEPPGHRGLLKLCTFSLILWPLEQFVCFLPSDKVFKSGFNQTLGFVTQLPSIPILFYEKKKAGLLPLLTSTVLCESCLQVMHACTNIYGCLLRWMWKWMCPAVADWNVWCVCKQSTVTGQLVPYSVTHFLLSPSLPPCFSLPFVELGISPGEGGGEVNSILQRITALPATLSFDVYRGPVISWWVSVWILLL